MNFWVGVTLAVLVAVVATDFLVRRYCDSKLARLYSSDDADALIEFLQTPPATFIYSLYNRQYALSHAYRLKGDVDGAEHAFDILLEIKTGDDARHKLCVTALEFFMEEERYGKAKAMLDEIEILDIEDSGSFAACKRLYDIVAAKSVRYIDELKDELAGMESVAVSKAREANVAKMQVLYLLAKSYENAGDEKNALYYTQKSSEVLAAV